MKSVRLSGTNRLTESIIVYRSKDTIATKRADPHWHRQDIEKNSSNVVRWHPPYKMQTTIERYKATWSFCESSIVLAVGRTSIRFYKLIVTIRVSRQRTSIASNSFFQIYTKQIYSLILLKSLKGNWNFHQNKDVIFSVKQKIQNIKDIFCTTVSITDSALAHLYRWFFWRNTTAFPLF